MTDEDYIRKAVELAEGWEWVSENRGGEVGHDRTGFLWYLRDAHERDIYLDALAAQLVRQVDAFRPRVDINFYYNQTIVGDRIGVSVSKDRTMNTIKAIVDSKVLE